MSAALRKIEDTPVAGEHGGRNVMIFYPHPSNFRTTNTTHKPMYRAFPLGISLYKGQKELFVIPPRTSDRHGEYWSISVSTHIPLTMKSLGLFPTITSERFHVGHSSGDPEHV